MFKSEYLEKKQRWFQAKYPETWEARWQAWVESNPEVPGDEPPKAPRDPKVREERMDAAEKEKRKAAAKAKKAEKEASKQKT